MQSRHERTDAPAALLPHTEENPFYVNVKYLLDPHYREGDARTTPFLYTTELTSCVGIGLIYREGEAVKKLALYHSATEHIGCEDDYIRAAIHSPFERNMGVNQKNLIRALYRFFYAIEDVRGVTIVIHSNNGPEEGSDSQNDDSYRDVVRFVQRVLQVMGHVKLPKENFLYSCHSPAFGIMNDGSFFAVSRPEYEQLAQKVAHYVAEEILSLPRKLKPLQGKSIFVDGHKKKVSALDSHMLQTIREAESGKRTWVEACHWLNDRIKILQEKKPKEAAKYDRIRFMLQLLDDANMYLWYNIEEGKRLRS
ncbi:hypothetical protein [Legionella taurinensis]|uniref:Uncharacterized protein n=1 Tax=Legionella taurinensis TaxID=70611 RepID=A0A3A5L5Q3_9GAMM|nr:hypothetical protein [Legionella taurinensis]RJT48198.1 hypothetical protein D6J04_03625 [Legionella taurinensis]RJT69138.1 hypothetical protein D6J03_03590 [Legionella taurinensis]STY25940.1 Uncharacterised protein [Legionella taurinensis]